MLSKEVLDQVTRLGGVTGVKSISARDINEMHSEAGDGVQVPAPIQQLFSIEWPDRDEFHYFADESSSFYWARGVVFHGFQYLPLSDWNFQDRGNKVLIGFANAKRSQNRIMLDLNDPNPADPQVYHIHMSYDTTLGSGDPLSAFLGSLTQFPIQ